MGSDDRRRRVAGIADASRSARSPFCPTTLRSALKPGNLLLDIADNDWVLPNAGATQLPLSTTTTVDLTQAKERFALRPSALAQVDKVLWNDDYTRTPSAGAAGQELAQQVRALAADRLEPDGVVDDGDRRVDDVTGVGRALRGRARSHSRRHHQQGQGADTEPRAGLAQLSRRTTPSWTCSGWPRTLCRKRRPGPGLWRVRQRRPGDARQEPPRRSGG